MVVFTRTVHFIEAGFEALSEVADITQKVLPKYPATSKVLGHIASEVWIECVPEIVLDTYSSAVVQAEVEIEVAGYKAFVA